MIPELGNFALILALCVALAQGTLPLIGAHTNRRQWIALARPAAVAQALKFGLFDLGRLEAMILQQVAGDFFRLDRGDDDA